MNLPSTRIPCRSSLQHVLAKLLRLIECIRNQEDYASLRETLVDAEGAVSKWTSTEIVDGTIPDGCDVSVLFRAIFQLDQCSIVLLNRCLRMKDSRECWSLLAPFIKSVSLLNGHTRHGMQTVVSELSTNHALLYKIIASGLASNSIDTGAVIDLALQAGLISLDFLSEVKSTLDAGNQQQESRVTDALEAFLKSRT